MAAFKYPTFQDRVASAASAKQTALDRLKAKPPVDQALAAEKRQLREARDRVIADERAAKAEAHAAAKAEKVALHAAEVAEAEAAALLKAARLKPPTAADMQAARDARYAARQARK